MMVRLVLCFVELSGMCVGLYKFLSTILIDLLSNYYRHLAMSSITLLQYYSIVRLSIVPQWAVLGKPSFVSI